MFLVDDLVTGPGKFVLWIFRQIHEAAKEELGNERQLITAELSRLHGLLESGSLSEEEFDEREHVLLDRLDAVEEQIAGDGKIAQG
jgi:hypothetical protein